jgi:hypothetical protein
VATPLPCGAIEIERRERFRRPSDAPNQRTGISQRRFDRRDRLALTSLVSIAPA